MPTTDPILTEANEYFDAYGTRRTADALVEKVFRDGQFTGKLYDTLGLNIKDAQSRYLIVNLLRAAVIDRTTMLSMLPDSKYDVPHAEDPDIALTEQDVLINLQRTLWDFWRMKSAKRVGAFNMALKNRALWMLYPDFDARKPMLYALDPGCFYGELDYRGDIPRCWLIWEEIGRRIWARYAHTKDDKRFNVTSAMTEYRVVEYWDKEVRRRWINDVEDTEHAIEHNFGYVPIRYTQDMHIPGSVDNLGNAYHAISLSENFTDVVMLVSQEMRRRINAVAWYKGGNFDAEQANAALRGEQMLDLGPDGEFGFARAVDGQPGAQQHLGALDDLFRVMMNWPRLRSGQISSSIWTARGIDAAQGAVSDDILQARHAIAADLEWLDDAAVHMMRKMWGDQEHNLLVFDSESVGSVKFIPNKDITHDWRHELIVFALAHDTTGKAVLLMQLFGQKLMDRLSILEQLPGVNGPEVMRRLEQDMQRDVEWQAAVQAKMLELQAQTAAAQSPEMQNQAMTQGQMPQEAGALLPNKLVPTPNPPFAGYMPR